MRLGSLKNEGDLTRKWGFGSGFGMLWQDMGKQEKLRRDGAGLKDREVRQF